MEKNFNIVSTRIDGVKILTPFYREDNRGYFLKDFEKDYYISCGLDSELYECFQSYSKANVIRGLHFQVNNPQIKIVSTIVGVVHDVVVDLRKNSKTFGEYYDAIISDENHNRLIIPKGFAHGFEVLSDYAIMSYKCIGKYDKGSDVGIVYNDTELGIKWNTVNPIVSERDLNLMSFDQFVEEYSGL